MNERAEQSGIKLQHAEDVKKNERTDLYCDRAVHNIHSDEMLRLSSFKTAN